MQLLFGIFIAPVAVVGLLAAWKAASPEPAAGASELATFRRSAIITFLAAAAYVGLFAFAAVISEFDGLGNIRDLERSILLIGAGGAATFAFSVLSVGGYTVAYLVFEWFRRRSI
ncbi:hypothetical protein OU426_02835 [Frigidibacter sp. RF13]|uniref:hypothetical protein n=1 Tax=Frigidibacter sp. RF13 TaxID=2997340 RepID=UPI0022716BEF|nr:hypothetical protein [Frigidibacter sp. RF13]MCY1125778.1 hypothetical protein [Frigidibacter sp. RF13]